MKKIGLLVLALVLALGTLGVAYAAWTDTIAIDGTVETGTLDINAVYFSGTDIYKNLADDSVVTVFWVKDAAGVIKWQSGTPPASNVLVASAAAAPTPAVDDSVDITFTGAIPSDYLVADVIIRSDGSVPTIVTADIDTDDELLEWLWDNGYASFQAAWVCINPDPFAFGYCAPIDGPIQMHEGNYAKVWLYLDLPQADDETMLAAGYHQEDFMNQDWEFTGHFEAIQWNESPYMGYADGIPCDCEVLFDGQA